MDLQLAGKRCLITGASRGIGRASARVLAAEGCTIAVVARRGALLDDLATEVAAAGGRRPVVVAEDLLAPDGPEHVYRQVISALGGIDVLVNNAGASQAVGWDAPESAWRQGMELNFGVGRRLATLFLPHMLAQRWGRIINVTGSNEPVGVNVATAAKAAVHNWAKGLSRQVAPDGVTVNCLAPGRLNTEQILQRLHPDPAAREEFIRANIPVGYFGEAEDLANVVAFIASPVARYITGEIVHVDGGMHRFAG